MSCLEVLLPVAVIWAVAAVTPGPNFFITVHTAVAQNRRSALFVVGGIVFGTLLWALAGFFGVSLIFTTVPALYYTFKIAGGLYLIYLGFNLLRGKRKNSGAPAEKKRLSSFGCFRLGFNTNILNPKTAAFMASLFAAAVPAQASLELGGLCALTICTVSTLWYSFAALVFSLDRAREAYQRFRTRIERAAGAVFVFFGVRLAVTD
ncbi:Threonine/homoserine/homoserine lactone efflux protein [Desulfatibacillum alkenivorans DSM 16219]|jgi:threonine/homoserine/homoserine lactone efflux protein|uniref:Threonine/homoserine/homoserine lactone efflux protein n=1 Tax=Desulfatibacillum alkenivorans DSM 16219 TaxID=1121393 RepID=A0A1M6CPE2_9BACT|nr:LysE family transporter [Desulfatibacillum alkenivorans]SHI62711.1 Threonine/homoserine/homoserine lactone efflux protein [Desulfatibacillum alkenivorans DSM 16219]